MMKLINKTRITDNLSVLIGQEHIDVIATEDFPFDVQIRFVKTNEIQLDNEEEKKVFTPEYQLAFAAVYKKIRHSLKVRKKSTHLQSSLKRLKNYSSSPHSINKPGLKRPYLKVCCLKRLVPYENTSD